jgi:hypothetical protein
MLVKIADAHTWSKMTYNNAISALRRAIAFGYQDHLERRDPAASLRSARIGKKDPPPIDPFSHSGRRDTHCGHTSGLERSAGQLRRIPIFYGAAPV